MAAIVIVGPRDVSAAVLISHALQPVEDAEAVAQIGSYYYFLYPTDEETPKSISVHFYFYSGELHEEKTESADENMELDYKN